MKRIIKLTSLLSGLLFCCMMLNACFSEKPTGDKDSAEPKAEIKSQSGSYMFTASRIDWTNGPMAQSYFVYDDNGNQEYEYTINASGSCVTYSLRKSVYDENNLEFLTQCYTLLDWDESEEQYGMKDEMNSYYYVRLFEGDKVIWERCPVLKYEKEFIYDENDQLIQINKMIEDEGLTYSYYYEYDENGNVTKSRTVSYDDQEENIDEFKYEYDSSGRIIKENDLEYEYDDEGRLIAKSCDGYIEQYTYVSTTQESRKNIELIEKEYDLSQIEAETEKLVEELRGDSK